MSEKTKSNLENAFSGESQAHMKYLIFSDVAQREGKANIARLFRAVAFAELAHARNHLRVLGGIQNTKANLQGALDGEIFEVEEMYPAYYNDSRQEGQKQAEVSINYALEAEKIHAQMYSQAKEAVSNDTDIDSSDINVCSICGYTVKGEAPEACPVCGAKKSLFKQF